MGAALPQPDLEHRRFGQPDPQPQRRRDAGAPGLRLRGPAVRPLLQRRPPGRQPREPDGGRQRTLGVEERRAALLGHPFPQRRPRHPPGQLDQPHRPRTDVGPVPQLLPHVQARDRSRRRRGFLGPARPRSGGRLEQLHRARRRAPHLRHRQPGPAAAPHQRARRRRRAVHRPADARAGQFLRRRRRGHELLPPQQPRRRRRGRLLPRRTALPDPVP